MNEEREEFHIFLPSNASFNEYPNNTQSNYTTNLHTPKKLIGKYEVAMTEISYSPLFLVDLGTITYKNFLHDYPTEYSRPKEFITLVKPQNGININNLAPILNSTCLNRVYLTEFNHRYKLAWNVTEIIAREFADYYHKNDYQNVLVLKKKDTYEIIDITSNSRLKDFFKSEGITEEFKFIFASLDKLKQVYKYQKFNFITVPEETDTYEDIKRVDGSELAKELLNIGKINRDFIPLFVVNENRLTIKFNGEMKINGLLSTLLTGKKETLINKTMSYKFQQKLNIINYAVVYADFIEPQLFGDECAQVLRNISMASSDSDVVSSFYNPIYVKVNKSELSSINIKIRDLQGELIQFKDIFTFVIVTLHFRPV